MEKVPAILLYSRPIFISAILVLSFYPKSNQWIVVGLIWACILTDILDGIIARQLNISTTLFRLLDTFFDLMFYLTVLFYVWTQSPSVMKSNQLLLGVLLSLECLLYIVSGWRFGKQPSPHAFLSKIWGLYLAIEFSLLILNVGGNHFSIALWFGVIVHVDRVLIYLLLKEWDHDIPSCYHAWLLRQGKGFTRHKLLNG